jgi:hypothetical protein
LPAKNLPFSPGLRSEQENIQKGQEEDENGLPSTGEPVKDEPPRMLVRIKKGP